MNLEDIAFINYIIKNIFIIICTYYTILKILNIKIKNVKLNIKIIICSFIICLIIVLLKNYLNSYIAIVSSIFLIGIFSSFIIKKPLGHSMLISLIAISINYIVFLIAIIIDYIINKLYPINNDFINLYLMIIIQLILLYRIFKTKKLKNGIAFFNKKVHDEYFEVIILNISVSILLLIIVFPYIMNIDILTNVFIIFFIFTIIMIITIQRTFQLYYKHKLLIKELEETKQELKTTKEEIKTLELDNLNISKRNHTITHKQKVLEHKINQLMMKTETSKEIDLKDKVENLSKEIYNPVSANELDKTGVESIDDVLDFMKSECDKNNIDFTLQILGNIYYMINNIITKDELETLIADHVKDAIIAIKHSNNINRSILVKLGRIEENYGIYIYDSGIEFEKETLDKLGKIPITTHKDEGGTGMGFMNTFETLNRHNASLIIEEIGKPSKDNYTKIIKIKFDEKQEFKIISYK